MLELSRLCCPKNIQHGTNFPLSDKAGTIDGTIAVLDKLADFFLNRHDRK